MIEKLNEKKGFFLFSMFMTCFICAVLTLSPILNQLDRVYNLTHKVSYAVLISCVYFVGLILIKNLIKFDNLKQMLIFVVSYTVIMAFKLTLFDSVTGDYIHYLSTWIDIMRENSIKDAIANKIGNYNMPYLYFLAGLSRFNFYDLYIIKLFSMFFEMICAYYAVKIYSLKTQSVINKLVLFCGILLTPTVVLNSAFWGQCDVVYVALVFAFLYYVFTDKPKLSLVMLALAFSFKLQTIFIMPILIVFVFINKINWKLLWVFPVTFIATIIPALVCGRSLEQALSVYISQTSSHTELTMNAHSVFSLINIGNLPETPFTIGGIFVAGLLTLALLVFLFVNRNLINDTQLLIKASLIFTVMIPFFLPRMHDRYFFMADLLAVLLLAFDLKKWYITALIVLSSLNSYCWYLFDENSLPIQVGAVMLIAVLIILFIDFFRQIRKIKSEKMQR